MEILRAGIAFARARGLTEMTDLLTAATLDALVDGGEHEQALELATELDGTFEASGSVFDLLEVRAAQARVLSLRGQAAQVADWLDWLETSTREAGSADNIVQGLGAALARAALGQNEQAAALLTEIETTPGSRESVNYAAFLLGMVRIALALGNRELAERLAAGVEPSTSYHEHALATVNAASPRPAATTRPPHRGTPTPPNAGSASASSPSRRSRSSARAAACSHSHDQATPTQSSARPARSSSDSAQPPHSPRQTRSSSRRPRSAPRGSGRSARADSPAALCSAAAPYAHPNCFRLIPSFQIFVR